MPAKPMTFKLTTEGKPRLTENDVEAQIIHFLQFRGWHVERMQSGMFRQWRPNQPGQDAQPVRIGRKGMVDWIALHPTMHKHGKPGVIFLEVKAPGKKPRLEQQKELRDRSVQGFLAGWFDSLSGFEWFYSENFE